MHGILNAMSTAQQGEDPDNSKDTGRKGVAKRLPVRRNTLASLSKLQRSHSGRIYTVIDI
eukprot:scaffold7267_cov395-Prasinococcus_capsulatus_cf.AAC.7